LLILLKKDDGISAIACEIIDVICYYKCLLAIEDRRFKDFRQNGLNVKMNLKSLIFSPND
jgi:hypothetical protein